MTLRFYWARSQDREKRLPASSCLSVRPSACNNLAPTGRILMKLYIRAFFFFENLSGKLKFYWNLTRITGTLHEDVFTFMTIYCSVILRIRNTSISNEKMKTHILCSVNFFPENRAVYEIKSKNMVKPERLQMTIWRRVACWVIKATHAHDFAHSPDLWCQPRLANVTCVWRMRLCGVTPAIIELISYWSCLFRCRIFYQIRYF
jgi:hypothetical protein